jgi:hypothetical protein
MPPPASVTRTPTEVEELSAELAGAVNPDGSLVSDCHFTISPAPPSGGSIPCAQQVGAGETPVGVSAAATGLTLGTTYTVRLIASSAQGESVGEAVQFTTHPAGPRCSCKKGSLSLVSGLTMLPRRFQRGSAAAKLIAGSVHGTGQTNIFFRLELRATVILHFEAPHAGSTLGGRCVHRRVASHRRCTYYTLLPYTVKRVAAAGADRIAFDGVLDHGHRLRPGIYRLWLQAIAGHRRASAPQRPTFTLLP